MRRGPKPAKSKEAKPPVARKSPKNDGARVRDLEERLAESLEREKATGEILRTISQASTDLQAVLDGVAESAARLCGATDAIILRVEDDRLRLAASYGSFPTTWQSDMALPITRGMPSGRAVLDRVTVHVKDLLAAPDTEFAEAKARARLRGTEQFIRTVLATPLLRNQTSIGAIVVRRAHVQPFSDEQLELLQTFADQAVIAIENVRLFTETKEALEQQTATSEILRVISSSPTDVQPVFEAITESAMRLFKAWAAAVFRYEGQLISMAAARGGLPGSADAVMAHLQVPHAPTEERPEGRAALTRTIQHVIDVEGTAALALMSWSPRYREDARARGFRSYVAVPMLRGEVVVGVITVSRQQVGGFAPGEISLLQTFADQAVIAIENVRLFNETKEALERQKATSEILQVISQSPTDVRPVFETIVENAVRLCDGVWGAVFQVEDDRIDLIAHYNIPPEGVEDLRHRYPAPLSANTG